MIKQILAYFGYIPMSERQHHCAGCSCLSKNVSIYYDKAWLTQLSAFPKVTNSSHRGGATIQWTRLKSQKQKEEKEMTKREKQKEKDMMKAEDMMKAKEIWYVVKHSTNVIETIESIARTLKTYRRKKK